MATLHPPYSKATVEVADDLVDRYLQSGWTAVPAPEKAPPKKAAAGASPVKVDTAPVRTS